MAFAKPLPIDPFRQPIEKAVEKNPLVVLTAETGAGKSTRVPYWFWKKGKRVHVTQPRRIAARSLAHYLARELELPLGREIGYQTGFETKKSEQTRLLYLTDGVKMVQEIKDSRDYDIMVLDEIHEWNLNQEVLIGLAKKLLDSGYWRRSGKRVLVMSATLKAGVIADFFGQAPVIDVPGRGYPVSLHHHGPLFLLPDAAQLVEEGRNVLVFQPGKQEIEDFSQNLRLMLEEEKVKAAILPFHSELSLRDQSRVFEHLDVPKVVVATDIAQTSLTIDDIDAVVDCGTKKEVQVVSGIEGLYPVDVSSSECLQRAGRAGRVKPGVYILCAEKGQGDRPEFPVPEIRRLNLETVILRMIKWGLDPLDFPFFHKPKRNLVLRALDSLKVFGAVTADLEVTLEGRRMAELPISVRSSRLLIEAEKGGGRVVDRALKVIAIIECKGIVSRDYQAQRYAAGPYVSDLLNQLALWEAARKNPRDISGKKMALAREIYQELKRRLQVDTPRGALNAGELRSLFRAILSSFVDGVFFRSDNGYCRGDEMRQLDRNSILALAEKKPGMVAGLAFDLTLCRSNSLTGKTEETQLPLLTFGSELSLAQLEELWPFSYRREREVRIEEGRLVITLRHFLGGQLLQAVEKQADWKDAEERELLVAKALAWALENLPHLPIGAEWERNRRWLAAAAPLLPKGIRSFEHYWEDFLKSELTAHLDRQDLAVFFTTQPGLQAVRLDRLLPATLVQRLRRRQWPRQVDFADRSLPVRRIGGRLFIEAGRDDFLKMEEADALLPTGEKAGIILAGRRYATWNEAVTSFNAAWKRDVFRNRWFFDRKPAAMADLLDIPFPLSFVGGRGKDNVAFEFYSVPMIEQQSVFLIHFPSREEALAYFDGFKPSWDAAKREYRKGKIDAIFREKGWRVK